MLYMARIAGAMMLALFSNLAAISPALAQRQTLAQNSDAQSNTINGYFTGQSFTAGSVGNVYNRVTISVLPADGSTSAGSVYLFSSQYTGTPSSLAGSTGAGNFVGRSTSLTTNTYTFAPSVSLTGGSTYYAYFDTSYVFQTSNADPYSGGQFYYSSGANTGYLSYFPADIVFSVQAAPEPGAWLLMILGFGVVGSSMRRRQRAISPRRSSLMQA